MDNDDRSVDSRGSSLLDEIEARLNRNIKMGILIAEGPETKKLTEKEKRELELQEYEESESIEQQLELELASKEMAKRLKRRKDFKDRQIDMIDQGTRKWLIKHGKRDYLDFQDDEIRKLKDCFNSLDDDGSGAIGMEELLEPLIGLGFADKADEVQQMVDMVDKDHSNQIEFCEFIEIIKNADSDPKMQALTKFFRDLNAGEYGTRDVSFNLFVLQLRRQYLLDAIKETDKSKKGIGRRIMSNIKEMMDQEKVDALKE